MEDQGLDGWRRISDNQKEGEGYRGEGDGSRVGAESDRKWGRMRVASSVGGDRVGLG